MHQQSASQRHGAGPKTFRAAEFFAGIGLVRLALESHGISVVFANDIDYDKLAMYKDNFDDQDFHLGDIHHLSAKDVPTCDLFTASFPCNDLSIAGAMAGINKGQSSSFWGFIRIVRQMGTRRPPLIMLENVPGFLMSHGGSDFEVAMMALNESGYVCDVLFLDAAQFTPQSRRRLFVIAKKKKNSYSDVKLRPSILRPRVIVDFIVAHPNIHWDVVMLPDPPDLSLTLPDIVEDLPDDHHAWWNRERVEYFMGQLSERHLAVAKKMIDSVEISYGTAFRRIRRGRSMAELRIDGLAGCLRTPRGGSGRQILFKAGRGKYQVRLLTPRECARLQGVPDSYKINAPLNQALFGFGDAVCVPAVSWLVENYVLPELRKIVSVNTRAPVGSKT